MKRTEVEALIAEDGDAQLRPGDWGIVAEHRDIDTVRPIRFTKGGMVECVANTGVRITVACADLVPTIRCPACFATKRCPASVCEFPTPGYL